jgi:hypothetical protein
MKAVLSGGRRVAGSPVLVGMSTGKRRGGLMAMILRWFLPCPNCNGVGHVDLYAHPSILLTPFIITRLCSLCDGAGVVGEAQS